MNRIHPKGVLSDTKATLGPLQSSQGWAALVQALPSDLRRAPSGTKPATLDPLQSSQGFILIFSLIMVMAVTSLAIGMIYNARAGKVSSLNYKHKIQGFYASDGMVTLMAQEVIDGRADRYIDTSVYGKMQGEYWESLSGTSIPALRTHIASRPVPTRVVQSNYLGAQGTTENYGVRWRGYIRPPVTGSYTFITRSTGGSAFRLSRDESPANLSATPIAYLNSTVIAWPTSGTGVSGPQFLEAGKRYYFEYLHKHGLGQGYGQIGWRGPNFMDDKPIYGKHLSSLTQANRNIYDTTVLGSMSTRYQLTSLSTNVYRLFSDSRNANGAGDTGFHLPLVQVLALNASGTALPDTHWMRVIYYDFRSDLGTTRNPEFQFPTPFSFFVYRGMVRSDFLEYETADADWFGLDSIGKPVVGANPRYNCMVEKWFRRWRPGDFTVPSYAAGNHDCSPDSAAHDSAFYNAVIKDSLPLLRRPDLGKNVYHLSRVEVPGGPLEEGFFPIDNRGLGNDNFGYHHRPHNFNFCMEMHSQFEYHAGLTFEFLGDDDLWVFVDGSLVLDMGYIHHPTAGSLEMGALAHLTPGETYSFDLFYCERQAIGSSFQITTNIPLGTPGGDPRATWSRDYGSLD